MTLISPPTPAPGPSSQQVQSLTNSHSQFQKKVYPKDLVRVSSNSRTLDAFFDAAERVEAKRRRIDENDVDVDLKISVDARNGKTGAVQEEVDGGTHSDVPMDFGELGNVEQELEDVIAHREATEIGRLDQLIDFKPSASGSPRHLDSPQPSSMSYTEVRLTSIQTLRDELQSKINETLTLTLRDHTYVGLVSPSIMLLQHQTKLLMVQIPGLTQTLVYQLALKAFSNYGTVHLASSLSLRDLIHTCLLQVRDSQRRDEEDPSRDFSEENQDDDQKLLETASNLSSSLVEQRAMLAEYFRIGITDSGMLECLPVIIKDHIPDLEKLPLFLARLGMEVRDLSLIHLTSTLTSNPLRSTTRTK